MTTVAVEGGLRFVAPQDGLKGGLASCGAGAGGRAVAGQAGAVVAGLLTAWEPEGRPGPHTCHAKMDQGASVIVHDASL